MQLYCEYCGKELNKEWLLIGAEIMRKDSDYGDERFCSAQCLLDSLNVLKESFRADGDTEIKGYYQLNQKECSEKEGK